MSDQRDDPPVKNDELAEAETEVEPPYTSQTLVQQQFNIYGGLTSVSAEQVAAYKEAGIWDWVESRMDKAIDVALSEAQKDAHANRRGFSVGQWFSFVISIAVEAIGLVGVVHGHPKAHWICLFGLVGVIVSGSAAAIERLGDAVSDVIRSYRSKE